MRRQTIALKDMAASEADFLLDVGRTKNLCVDDGRGEIEAEAAERAQRKTADLVAARFPRALREAIRNVLREDAHGVQAGGGDGGVVNTLEVQLAPKPGGQFAAARSRESFAPLGFGERRVDLAVVVRLIGAGTRGEFGQFAEQNVELDGAAFDGNALDAGAPSRVGGGSEQAQCDARIGIGNHDRRSDALTMFEENTLAGKNLGDGDTGGDDGSGFASGVAEIKGDHAHAALHVAPHAGQAAETAGSVVEADGGGTWVEGAGVRADDTLAEIRRLQPLVFEIALDELGHGPVVQQVAGFVVVAEARVDFFG